MGQNIFTLIRNNLWEEEFSSHMQKKAKKAFLSSGRMLHYLYGYI